MSPRGRHGARGLSRAFGLELARTLAAAAAVVALIAAAPGVFAQTERGYGYGRGQPHPRLAIAGRVTDVNGTPVPDVFVTALSLAPKMGWRPHPWMGDVRLRAITDARGGFQLNDLSAGEYYLIAMPHNGIYAAPGRLNTFGHANTFYPNAARFEDARRVIVKATGAAAVANIMVRSAPLAMVSGVVIGSNGRPVTGGRLGLAHGGFFGFDTRVLPIGPDGRFAAPALAPGTYIFEFRESAWPPPRGVTPAVSGARVTVAGADLANVRVAPIHMVPATGRLIGPVSVLSRITSDVIDISARSEDCCPGPTRLAIVRPDRTFEFAVWPGDSHILVNLRVPGLAVKGIRLKGVDVTNTLVPFVDGRPVTGLEIELTPEAISRPAAGH
jgi:hypothetical protein